MHVCRWGLFPLGAPKIHQRQAPDTAQFCAVLFNQWVRQDHRQPAQFCARWHQVVIGFQIGFRLTSVHAGSKMSPLILLVFSFMGFVFAKRFHLHQNASRMGSFSQINLPPQN